jgi:hypothetical protein
MRTVAEPARIVKLIMRHYTSARRANIRDDGCTSGLA